MAKMKVADLPQEQRDKLIAEAKELEIRGIVTGWAVETLEAKIAEIKAQKQNQQANEQNNGKDEQNTQNNEQNDGNNEQNAQTNEQNDEGVIVAGDGGVHPISPENEQAPAENEGTQEQNQETPAEEQSEPQQNAQSEESETPVDVVAETEEQLPPGTVTKKAAKQAPKKTPICHICRSKVIDGECQGCGFKVVR